MKGGLNKAHPNSLLVTETAPSDAFHFCVQNLSINLKIGTCSDSSWSWQAQGRYRYALGVENIRRGMLFRSGRWLHLFVERISQKSPATTWSRTSYQNEAHRQDYRGTFMHQRNPSDTTGSPSCGRTLYNHELLRLHTWFLWGFEILVLCYAVQNFVPGKTRWQNSTVGRLQYPCGYGCRCLGSVSLAKIASVAYIPVPCIFWSDGLDITWPLLTPYFEYDTASRLHESILEQNTGTSLSLS